MRQLHAFGLAWQFLTRFPSPRNLAYTPATQAWSVVWYPLVGLLLGGLLWLLSEVLGDTSPLLQAALVLLAWVVATGGLHWDGLADSADAWAGGRGDPDRSLRILQEPSSGPIAIVAVMLVLLLKFASLTELLQAQAKLPLLWIPALGRSAILWILLTTPYVRPNGLGSGLVEHLPKLPVLIAALSTLLGTALSLGWPAPVAFLLGLAGLRWLMLRSIGGCTGDTLGASVELLETLALVTCALSLS